MKAPFRGMDPYLEHPVLWEGVHARLINVFANQLQPLLDPRYVASIEERVFIEGPQRRIPDLWVQKVRGDRGPLAQPAAAGDTAVILEVEELELHQHRVEVLDVYNDLKLVALIELVSPTNKYAGPGRDSYLAKQKETRDRDCHLVEIDLLRRGPHVLSVPKWRLRDLGDFDYLTCVSRWPKRHRYELYPRRLREPLPTVKIPLSESDPDVPLNLQAAIEQVFWEGRYMLRVRYEEPCVPRLSAADQQWASGRWREYKGAHPELFPPPQPSPTPTPPAGDQP